MTLGLGGYAGQWGSATGPVIQYTTSLPHSLKRNYNLYMNMQILISTEKASKQSGTLREQYTKTVSLNKHIIGEITNQKGLLSVHNLEKATY